MFILCRIRGSTALATSSALIVDETAVAVDTESVQVEYAVAHQMIR